MDGLIYLLNQAGIALAEANQQIAHLKALVQRQENTEPDNTQ